MKVADSQMMKRMKRVVGTICISTPDICLSSPARVALRGRWATMPQPALATGAKPASISTPRELSTSSAPLSPASTSSTAALPSILWPIRLGSGW
ncbi:hypothetical protein D3C85_1393020 [compost metagenome]